MKRTIGILVLALGVIGCDDSVIGPSVQPVPFSAQLNFAPNDSNQLPASWCTSNVAYCPQPPQPAPCTSSNKRRPRRTTCVEAVAVPGVNTIRWEDVASGDGVR
jgi:hypothetical protein